LMFMVLSFLCVAAIVAVHNTRFMTSCQELFCALHKFF
jgi:hypothetical protein